MAAKRGRLWVVAGVTAFSLLAGAGAVVAFPPAAPQGPLLVSSTVTFQEQGVLSWAEDGLQAADPAIRKETAAGVVKAGNEAVYGWNNGVTNVFTGDFNADGKWDVGVTGTAEQGDRCWYIRYGDGKGSFNGETKYCWNNGVTNVFSGDFNGDGKWDIGVTGTAAQKDRYWYIRYGDGKGGFGNETTYWWGNGVTNVFTGDFNGDGKWDIGVTGTAAEGDRRWYIRYGDGRGSFGGETTYWWGNGVANVFTGDFNGDGKWDIGVTGTANDRDRTWYIRYGDGKGQFGSEDTYAWGNGVTNLFTGDFNGDKLWDLGVTGDRLQKNGNWYIRFNQTSGQNSNPPAPPAPPANDPVLEKARKLTDQAYRKLLERAPTEAELSNWAGQVKSGKLTYEQVWTAIARSQERLDKFGFYAPSYGDYNGKKERCFGAVGPKCDGVWLLTPDVQIVNTFDRADGVKMGYVRIAVAVGSILHDNICLDQPYGAWCSGAPTIISGEIPLMRVLGPAAREWNKAVYNVRDTRYWMHTFGPYPVDKALQENWSDDLTQVQARPSKMAKILPVGAMPVVTDDYLGKETRQTKALKAPVGTYVDRYDQQFCQNGKYKEEGRWWTGQWWGQCN